jgi:chemotaxis protein CheX
MKSILMIGPEFLLKEKVNKLLEETYSGKYKLTIAEDAIDAFTMAEKQKFDCVIIDLKTPKIEGNPIIKNISLLPIETKPVNVLICAKQRPADIGKFKGYFYLNKPFDRADFLDYLDKNIFTVGRNFKLDVSFINPFIEATIEVIQLTANTKVTKESVFIRSNDVASGDISAMVSMISSKFTGSFAIAFEKNCYLEIASNMLYEEQKMITNENQDAAAEICNQVFGKTKAVMNDQLNLDIAKAIPAIIVGDKHTIKHQVIGPCLAVKFRTSQGAFTIEVVLR